MHWLVYGAGAVGGVLGARMHDAGLDVTLVARGAHLAAIRSHGLRLATPDGERTVDVPPWAARPRPTSPVPPPCCSWSRATRRRRL